MRARFALLTCALLASQPALAQRDPVLTADIIEARRPVIVERALSVGEKARARTLVAQLQAAPTEALLEQLRPLANSGDSALMRAMWKGYGKAVLTTRAADDPLGWQMRTILEAQWAIELWRKGEQDREVALTISNCFNGISPAGKLLEHRECGYDRQASEKTRKRNNDFNGYVSKYNDKPDVTFTPRRAALEPGWAQRRFEAAVLKLREQNKRPEAMEIRFADSYAQHVVPGLHKFWADLRDLDDVRIDRKRRGELAGAQAKRLDEWVVLARRQQTERRLSEADREAWFKLSVRLGGNGLTGYASAYPLTEAWQVDAVCAYAAGRSDTACRTQRGLLALRVSGAAPGPTIPVQSYDVAGNPTRIVAIPRSAFDLFRR